MWAFGHACLHAVGSPYSVFSACSRLLFFEKGILFISKINWVVCRVSHNNLGSQCGVGRYWRRAEPSYFQRRLLGNHEDEKSASGDFQWAYTQVEGCPWLEWSFSIATGRVAANLNFTPQIPRCKTLRNQKDAGCRNRIYGAPSIEPCLLWLEISSADDALKYLENLMLGWEESTQSPKTDAGHFRWRIAVN